MKKMISLLITILLSISMVTGCAVSAGVDKTAAKMEKAQPEAESAQLYIDIEFQENLFFDKYDVELYLDDNRLTTMPHGQNYTELVQTTVGDHVIKFINETDDSVKTTKNITVKGDMTFQCEIRTHDDEIEIVDIDLIDSVEGASLRVDNYIGTVLSVAEDKLEESGFANVKSESDGDGSIWDSDNWVVMEQSVVPGTEMDKNDPIILTCRKTETYLNENYGGLNIPEAREKADELGHILLYKNHLTEEDLGVRVEQMDEDELSLWSVREVDKSLYEEKKAVLELIYTGEREVPDVTGISLRDAFSKLYAADFSNVEEKAENGDSIWVYGNWKVISQSAPAGENAKADEKIVLTCRKFSEEEASKEESVAEAEETKSEDSGSEQEDDGVSAEYKKALKRAQSYSDHMYMSKADIYDQLTSEYGEGFAEDAAQYAVDHVDADWNQNALKSAQSYSKTLEMSKKGIYDQLVSEYGGQFTADEAQYAIDNVEADWNQNALHSAESYSKHLHMSKRGIYDQLISEYGDQFTPDEAQYAVDNIDADWNENALESARSYQRNLDMSKSEIYDQLVSEYGDQFTSDQAHYAIDHLDD